MSAVAAPGTPDLGFSAGDLVGMPAGDLVAHLDAMVSLGATSVRFDLSWATVQPSGPDAYDWSLIDAVVGAARARGLSSLPVLDYTPAWARPAGCRSAACGPADPRAFARFAAAAAARYGPRGISRWEIWNEPNAAFWLPRPDVAAYAMLLKRVTNAVRNVNPDAEILVGGLAPAQSSPGGFLSPGDFLTGLYEAGARWAFTGVAAHPYCFPALPGEGQAWSGWSQMVAVHDIMLAHGDFAKHIWATELGAPTEGDRARATLADRRYDQAPDHVDEQLQAETVTAAFAQARRLPWLRGLYWYGLRDLEGRAGNEASFGLLRSDGSAKQAAGRWAAEAARTAG